jgi:hypothetical protein
LTLRTSDVAAHCGLGADQFRRKDVLDRGNRDLQPAALGEMKCVQASGVDRPPNRGLAAAQRERGLANRQQRDDREGSYV